MQKHRYFQMSVKLSDTVSAIRIKLIHLNHHYFNSSFLKNYYLFTINIKVLLLNSYTQLT